MSPKEQLFLDQIKTLHECSISTETEIGFSVEYFAELYYGRRSNPEFWPPFWRQATMATLSRVIRKIDGMNLGFKVTKTHKRGRGRKALYTIVNSTATPSGSSVSDLTLYP